MSKKREWPPMKTRDGKNFELGMLVYSPDVYLNRRDEDRNRVKIECYRVIDLSLQYRQIRLRCHKGCETFIKAHEGCNRDGYYATKEAALAEASRQITKQEDEWRKEIKVLEASIKSAAKVKIDHWPVPAA